MKRKIVFFCCLLLVACCTHAQTRHDANWVFGEGAGMHFNEDGTVSTFKADTYNWEANATISDSAGNLLFYLADNSTFNFYMMLRPGADASIINNDSILGNESVSNGGIFIPSEDNRSYHFYYIAPNPDSIILGYEILNLYYAHIIKEQNTWQVDVKDKRLAPDNLLEKIAVTKHVDGNCFWLVSPKYEFKNCNDGFKVLKICEGIVLDSFSIYPSRNYCHLISIGDMEFSANGNLLANTISSGYLETFTFDRCTGNLVPYRLIQLQGDGTVYGTAFSSDGSKLYLTQHSDVTFGTGGRRVYQYNFDDSTLTLLYDFGGIIIGNGQMERGPNGKVYMSSCGYRCRNEYTNFTQCLSVINNPNAAGLACDFQPESFCFPDSARITLGLPNFPNYNLGAEGAYRASAGPDRTFCAGSSSTVVLGSPEIPGILYNWSCNFCPALDAWDVAQPTVTGMLTQDTWYVLTATDTSASNCASVNTDSVLIRLDTCTSITEPQTLQAKLFPNPTTGNLTIELPNGQSGSIELYNLLGQSVFNASINSIATLQMDLPKGVYIYRIDSGGKTLNGKLIIE